MTDLIIRQARVIDAFQDNVADVAVTNGNITQVAETIADNAHQEIDASGLVLMPGGIDPHVHFNDPGRTHWEGLHTGSRALAKGGFTSFFDMPLNSSPVTTTLAAYHEKRRLADEKSVVNAYLWGGLTPNNLDDLADLAQTDIIGFKAFMSNSGLEDFAAVDDYTLYRGMELIATTGKIVAVHAENDSLTSQLAHRAIATGQVSIRDYLASRPIVAELEAIQRAILLAAETGCKLHIVHVSTAQGVDLVSAAQENGVDVTCETCPHYLMLTDEDMIQMGAVAKCAPPLRPQVEKEVLWQRLLNRDIPIIASDHSPAPLSMKQGDNFFKIWGGIASCQSTWHLLLTEGYHRRGMGLQQLSQVLSYATAQRFGLAHKGLIAPEMDADFFLADIEHQVTLKAEDLLYRHPVSPYIGKNLYGYIHSTWVGGKRIYG